MSGGLVHLVGCYRFHQHLGLTIWNYCTRNEWVSIVDLDAVDSGMGLPWKHLFRVVPKTIPLDEQTTGDVPFIVQYVVSNLWPDWAHSGHSLWDSDSLGSSRSLYAHLIPEGKEAQFFGLYQFTNKGSSWIGPLLATFISNAFDLRTVFAYILLTYLVSIPILWFKVDHEQGMIDAGKIKALQAAAAEEGRHDSGAGTDEITDGHTPVQSASEVAMTSL